MNIRENCATIRHIRISMTFLVILMLTLACTVLGEEAPNETIISTAIPSPTTISTSSLVHPELPSGRLTLGIHVEPSHWDVHLTSSPVLASWGPGLVYSRLMRFLSGPGIDVPNMGTECDLCTHWEQVTPTEYKFYIRDDVFWPDIDPVNGRTLVASDIVFSYERQRTKDYPNAYLLNGIKDLEALDRNTLRITLESPDSDLLAKLASGYSKVVSHEAVNVKGDLKHGPVVGTGPWVWGGDRNGIGYFLDANTDYYENGFPQLDKLALFFIPDRQTHMAAFRSGLIDLVEMPASDLATIKKQHPEIESLIYKEAGNGLEISLNTRKKPLDNIKIRQALFKAMDPWSDIENIWQGYEFVSLGMPIANPEWLLGRDELEEYLLDPAGSAFDMQSFPQQKDIPVVVTVAYFSDRHLEYGRSVVDKLVGVGLNASLKTISPTKYADEVWFGGDYQVYIGPIAPILMPNMYFDSVLHSRGDWNTHGYSDAHLDDMIDGQRIALDPLERRDLVIDIQRYVFEKSLRFMPVTRASVWAWWPRVNNFSPNLSAGEYFHLAKVGVN